MLLFEHIIGSVKEGNDVINIFFKPLELKAEFTSQDLFSEFCQCLDSAVLSRIYRRVVAM